MDLTDATITSEMLTSGLLQGFWMFIEMCWFPLLVLFIFAIALKTLEYKLGQRNRKLRKQREEKEWEERMEKFLDKKDRHDRMKK